MAVSVRRTSDLHIGTFLKKRLVRIYPTYWIWLLSTVVCAQFWFVEGASPITVVSLVSSVTLIPSWFPSPEIRQYPLLPVGWTLYYEVCFYLLIGILLPLRRFSYLIWVTACLLLLTLAGRFLSATPVFGTFWSYWKIREFSAGILIGSLFLPWLGRSTMNVRVIAATGMFLLTALTLITPKASVPLGKDAVLAASMVAAVISIEEVFDRFLIFRPLILLGTWSYSTYLCHWIVIATASHVVENVGTAWEPLVFVAAFASIAAMSAASFHFVESGNGTVIRKLFRRKLKRTPPGT
jgi:peptidoglycan/LPS O-acetylase OafA/YrhL